MKNKRSKLTLTIFSLLLIFSFNTAYALDTSGSKLSEVNINKVLNAAHEKFKDNKDGKNADYIKALADVDSKLFGITIVTVDGKV